MGRSQKVTKGENALEDAFCQNLLGSSIPYAKTPSFALLKYDAASFCISFAIPAVCYCAKPNQTPKSNKGASFCRCGRVLYCVK